MTVSKQYDVFLSHNSADQAEVEALATKLREAGLDPFLDKWHLIPGEPWQEAVEEALDQSQTCAVFLGPAGLGTWENEEMRAALDKRSDVRDFRVIPVLLPGARLPQRGRLPAFLARYTWVDFRPGLDDAQALHALVSGIQGIAPDLYALPDAEAVCPFRGLEPFDEDHAPFFFGRQALIQHLTEHLREDRYLAVLGPSGSGKSSLVRAGLVPQVRAGALPASDHWRVVLFKPGAQPVEALAARLLPHLGQVGDPYAAQRSLVSSLQTDERGLHNTVQIALAAEPDNRRLLIVVDQFEEVFTACQDEQARQVFIANLLYASTIAGGQTVVVVTMRADFFGHCAAYPGLAAWLAERDVLVGPMTEEEQRQTIVSPAEVVGLRYEKGLVNGILEDLGHEPGMLPLLQHTLLELWQQRRGGWLTVDTYQAIGGVKGALTQRAEATYHALTPAQQVAARRVLLRLTVPGEGTEDTRRRARLAELLPAEGETTDVETAIRKMVDARLLTTNQDEQGQEVIDVSHEALIRGWPRLQAWIEEDHAALRIHRRLTEAAQEWEEQGRNRSFLYRGARLATATEWARERAARLNPLEQRFLQASQRATRRDRMLTVGGIALTVAFVAVVISLALTGQFNRWIYRPLPIDWVEIPAGYFRMGSSREETVAANKIPLDREDRDIDGFYNLSDEEPDHWVYLDTYQIGRYEVTNRQYRQCVRAGTCSPPSNEHYAERDWADHPVTGVNWEDARIFCAWNEATLPTEAQWEKAARGMEDDPPRYPWGDDFDPQKANVKGKGTSAVGSYSQAGGDSPYGLADMAGNVWEWTLDWYKVDYYEGYVNKPVTNPAGPQDGDMHTLRGGSYANDWIQARSARRLAGLRPGDTSPDVGFRCAWGVAGPAAGQPAAATGLPPTEVAATPAVTATPPVATQGGGLVVALVVLAGLIVAVGAGLFLILRSQAGRKAREPRPSPAPQREARPATARLVLQRGQAEPSTVRLGRHVVRLGRSAQGNDVVIQDSSVSAHHAEIRMQDGQHILHDMNSTNGTFVNGQRLAGPYGLRPGDRIALANTEWIYRREEGK